MADEVPPSENCRKILSLLSDIDYRKVMDKRILIQEEKERQRWNSLSLEEQAEEKRKIEKSLQEGPEVFRGNILQQEWDSMELSKIEKEKEKKKKE